MDNPNREILLQRLSEAQKILADLEKQLKDNEESFKRAVSGSICDTYLEQTKLALEKCSSIKKQLSQLQKEEQVRL